MATEKTDIQMLREVSERTYEKKGQLSELLLSLFLVSGMLFCFRDLYGSVLCLPVSMASACLTIFLLQLTVEKQKLQQRIRRGLYLFCFVISIVGFSLLVQGFLETVNRVRELCNLKFYTEFFMLGNGTQIGAGSILFWTVLAVLLSVWILQQLKKRAMAGIFLPVLAVFTFALVFEQPDLRVPELLLSFAVAGLFLYYEAPGRRVYVRGVCCFLLLIVMAGGIFLVSGNYRISSRIEDWKELAGEWLEQVRYGKDTLPEGNLKEASGLLAEDKEMLILTMDQPQELYLRGYVGSDYESGEWNLLNSSAYQGNYAGILKWLKKQQFSPVIQYGDYIRLTEAELGTRTESVQVTVENTGASRKYIYLPATAYDWSAGFSGEKKDWQVQSSGLLGTKKYTFADGKGAQTADGVYPADWLAFPSDDAEQQYLDAEAVYHSFAEDSYMELAPELETMTDELFPDGFDDLDFSELTAEIRLALRTNFRYTEQPENAPQGKDPLLWFLTESKEGNAVYYASAAVLAYRAAGYPARYVEGYHLSAGDAAAMQAAGETEAVLTSRNAHAWVEVYVAGVGWLPVEVVPGFYVETYTSQTIAGKPSFRMNPSSQEEGESPEPSTAPGHFGEGSGEQPDFLEICRKISAAAILFFYLCVLIWIVMGIQRRIRIYLRNRKKMPEDVRGQLLLYLAVSEQTLRLAGVQGDFAHPKKLWNEVHEALPALEKEEYDRALELVQKARFGGKNLRPHEWHTLRCFQQKMRTLLYEKGNFIQRKILRDIYLFE